VRNSRRFTARCTSQTFKAGDVTGEPGTTIHWHRNDGKDAVILITADIFKPAN